MPHLSWEAVCIQGPEEVGRVANRGEDGPMPLGQVEVGLPGRFCRVGRCRTFEALHFCRHAGRKLYKIGAEKFIPVHLELGGSDAGIVCEDANIDEAVPQIFGAKFCNNGQICCGLKRLIVHVTRFDETVQKLATYIKARRIGDPLQKDTELGPLVAQRQVDLLKAQVEDARTQGATIVVGGREPPGLKGAYYEPTLITGVKPSMRVWKEEVFGPVLPVVSYKTEDEAITLANDTIYGLSGYIYTRQPGAGRKARIADANRYDLPQRH